MKKSLLLASMALLGMSAVAQGVDPVEYPVKEGYQLENLWLMSVGANNDGVATDDFNALPFAVASRARTSVIHDGKVYIACNDGMKMTTNAETGESYMAATDGVNHIIVLDAATGEFIKDMPVLLNGVQREKFMGVNQIGVDAYGHLWVCAYCAKTYDDATNEASPMDLYQLDPETGEITLVNTFMLDEIDGPKHGSRVDHYDLVGDLTGENSRCVFMAAANELVSVYAWSLEQGATDWHISSTEEEITIYIDSQETDPADQLTWGVSTPAVSIYRDEDFSGTMYYVDGHGTRPVLYDYEGAMIDSFKNHTADEEGWTAFYPSLGACGVLQIGLNGQQFLAYGLNVPDPNKNVMGGNLALVKLDADESLNNATPMWVFPEANLGLAKAGVYYHSITTGKEYSDANGKKAIDILLYFPCNGIGLYRLAEEGFQAESDGIEGVEIDNSNAPVEYFNLQGVRVAEPTNGFYLRRQGTEVTKVVK